VSKNFEKGNKIEHLKIINLLESLLNNDKTIDIENEINNFKDKNLEEIIMNLNHYFSDEDIREKDTQYRIFQKNELKKLIDCLKVNNFEKANKISFLQTT
jgi:hypothetical protein